MIWNEPGGLHAVLCERALASCYVEDLGGHILHKRLSSSVGRLINEKISRRPCDVIEANLATKPTINNVLNCLLGSRVMESRQKYV
jgi:hypothetical protein